MQRARQATNASEFLTRLPNIFSFKTEYVLSVSPPESRLSISFLKPAETAVFYPGRRNPGATFWVRERVLGATGALSEGGSLA